MDVINAEQVCLLDDGNLQRLIFSITCRHASLKRQVLAPLWLLSGSQQTSEEKAVWRGWYEICKSVYNR